MAATKVLIIGLFIKIVSVDCSLVVTMNGGLNEDGKMRALADALASVAGYGTGTIVDVDECNIKNECSTNALCSNTHGGYSCYCKDGYVDESPGWGRQGAKCVDECNKGWLIDGKCIHIAWIIIFFLLLFIILVLLLLLLLYFCCRYCGGGCSGPECCAGGSSGRDGRDGKDGEHSHTSETRYVTSNVKQNTIIQQTGWPEEGACCYECTDFTVHRAHSPYRQDADPNKNRNDDKKQKKAKPGSDNDNAVVPRNKTPTKQESPRPRHKSPRQKSKTTALDESRNEDDVRCGNSPQATPQTPTDNAPTALLIEEPKSSSKPEDRSRKGRWVKSAQKPPPKERSASRSPAPTPRNQNPSPAPPPKSPRKQEPTPRNQNPPPAPPPKSPRHQAPAPPPKSPRHQAPPASRNQDPSPAPPPKSPRKAPPPSSPRKAKPSPRPQPEAENPNNGAGGNGGGGPHGKQQGKAKKKPGEPPGKWMPWSKQAKGFDNDASLYQDLD